MPNGCVCVLPRLVHISTAPQLHIFGMIFGGQHGDLELQSYVPQRLCKCEMDIAAACTGALIGACGWNPTWMLHEVHS